MVRATLGHTSVVLMKAGIEVIILDNLSNSSSIVLERIAKLGGSKPHFFEGDVRDCNFLDFIFSKHKISSVIHFAGLRTQEKHH